MPRSPSIRPVTFEEADARYRTVVTGDEAGRALIKHGDTASKEYRKAVKSCVALSEGTGDPEKVRADFIAALRVAGVFVRDD